MEPSAPSSPAARQPAAALPLGITASSAAKRDIWRPADLLKAFEEAGFSPSLSKVAALWSGKPISVLLLPFCRLLLGTIRAGTTPHRRRACDPG
jgi:hypothetical protein